MEENSAPREEILNSVKNNMSHEDVKAYLNRDDPRHKAVVDEVTALVESAFGGSADKRGMFEKDEDEIRQNLYDDPDSVTDQLQKIYKDPSSKWHKPYFDSNDPLHAEAVRRVQILSEAKHGDGLYEKEIMPIRTSTGPTNAKQAAAFIDDRNEGGNS